MDEISMNIERGMKLGSLCHEGSEDTLSEYDDVIEAQTYHSEPIINPRDLMFSLPYHLQLQ